MASDNLVIKSVFYASPYCELPPGVTRAGVTVQANTSQIPSGITNPILVIRLRLTTSPETIGISPTTGSGISSTTAVFQPSFPLSATEPYMVDVMWVEQDTPIENIDWNSALTSAPVTASDVTIRSASYDGTNLIVGLSYGASGIGVGAQVNVYALSSDTNTYVGIGNTQTEGTEVSFTFTNPGYTEAYFVSAQSAIPANNLGGAGSFAAPFSLGPVSLISEYSGIPQAAKTITVANYDGNNLVLNWDLDTIPGCVAPDGSIVEVLADGQVVASFEGGPVSANIPVDVLGQTSVTTQVRTMSNNMSSAPISLAIISEEPVVTDVVGDKAGGTVTASVSTVPSGPNIQAYLMDGQTQLAGPESLSSGKVSFDYSTANYNVEDMVGISVVARAASSDSVALGPTSAPATLLATTPILLNGSVYTDPDEDTKWKIVFEWDRLPDAAIDVASYTVSIIQDSISLVSQTLAKTTVNLTLDKSQIDTTKEQTVELYATGSTGGDSPILSLSMLFTAPELDSVVTSSDQIGATWVAPTIPSSNTMPVTYQMVLATSGGTAISSSNYTSGTQAAIPLANLFFTDSDTPIVLVNISIGVITLQSDASIATKCSASPILGLPAIGAVTVNPLSNKSTLNWHTVSGATSYNINFTDGTSQLNVTTNSYTLPSALTVDSQLGFTVESNATSNQVPVTGPATEVVYIPTNTANVGLVRFNGALAKVFWDAVPEAKSYTVYVYDNASTPVKTYSGSSTETSLSFEITVDTTKVYTVYVQAVMSAGEGLCGKSLGLFTTALFPSKELASVAYPYLYPAEEMSVLGTADSGPVATEIVLYLPELGAADGALGTVPITVDPFTIEPSGDANLPYKLTIAAEAIVWSFDTDYIRATLQSAYVDFLKAVEIPPDNGEGATGATPYGISLVQAAIGRYMPQTFDELLYYNFGFSTDSTVGSGYIDLRPGMILRATISSYINISEYSLPSWLLGYAGATVLDFDIGSYSASGDWRVGFDGFLNTLSAQGALAVDVPPSGSDDTQAGLAGATDLYYPQFVQPFYRLYIPDKIQNSWGTGSNKTSSNFTLVAASSYSTLQTTDVNPNNTPTAYFRGRTTLEAMIKVYVNGSEQIVPVGTSVGNLLQQSSLRPVSNSRLFNVLRVYRSIEPAITNTNLDSAQGPVLEIRFDWDGFTAYSSGNGVDAMSMPLLPGDQISYSDENPS